MFGGRCPEQGIGFVVPVPDRKARTLEPEMIRNIAPGSMIHHDDWPSYRRPRYSRYWIQRAAVTITPLGFGKSVGEWDCHYDLLMG